MRKKSELIEISRKLKPRLTGLSGFDASCVANIQLSRMGFDDVIVVQELYADGIVPAVKVKKGIVLVNK